MQEENERTNIILTNLLTNLNFKENENEWDLWGSRTGGSECDNRKGFCCFKRRPRRTVIEKQKQF